MLSLIVCSKNPDIPAELRLNVSETIGCSYEWVIINNSQNRYSIFEAYNLGVSHSIGDILCFIHDDILFHSHDWGIVLSNIFLNKDIGCVGVAGGHFIPHCVSYWNTPMCISTNMIQGGDGVKLKKDIRWRNNEDVLVDVAAVDGLFMAFPKSIYKTIRWDDKTYYGFHAYDMDISMQVLFNATMRVVVTREILIEHCSLGNENLDFFRALEVFYHKWINQLPILIGADMSESEQKERTEMVEKIIWLQTEWLFAQKSLYSNSYKITNRIRCLLSKIKKYLNTHRFY